MEEIDKTDDLLQKDVVWILEKASGPLPFSLIWDELAEESIDVHVALERLFRAGKVDRLEHIQPTCDGVLSETYWILKRRGRNVRAWKFE